VSNSLRLRRFQATPGSGRTDGAVAEAKLIATGR